MRVILVLLLGSVAAACSGPPERKTSESLETMDVSESPAARGPGVNVSAAPGVAFQYAYAFRLPNAKIAAVQEEHAQACERLGLDRCRITGMRYSVAGADDISATLAVKLAPSIARAFGKQGVVAIERADGMLIDAEITGTDAAATIDRASGEGDTLRDDLARIEARLARPGLGSAERAELIRQVEVLRERIRDRDDARASLATTPMTFAYNSGSALRGEPLRDAWVAAASSFVTVASVLLIVIGVLLPWVLIGGLLWWLTRPLWRRLRQSRRVTTDQPA